MDKAETTKIVRDFVWEFWRERTRQIGQLVPGADMDVQAKLPSEAWENPFPYMMEAQEWLALALYGAGLTDEDPLEMREACQSLAEWLFGIPGSSAYAIPDEWADTAMGALWWAALVRTEGDELITIAQAAEIAGVTVQAISGRIERGTLRSFTDPASTGSRQGRRLVRRSDL